MEKKQKVLKKVPYMLALFRAISFVPMILGIFNVVPLSLLAQLLLSLVIIVSDKFDGEISRKYNDEKNKLKFRLFDTAIDKTGIGLCLIGLLATQKIPIHYFVLLFSYNGTLLSGGLYFLIDAKKKSESTIQGLFLSRLFTMLTGFSILLYNNMSFNRIFETLLTLSMGTLGLASLKAQLKDKTVQKQEQLEKGRIQVFDIIHEMEKEKINNLVIEGKHQKEELQLYRQIVLALESKLLTSKQQVDHTYLDLIEKIKESVLKEVPEALLSSSLEEVMTYIMEHQLIESVLSKQSFPCIEQRIEPNKEKILGK